MAGGSHQARVARLRTGATTPPKTYKTTVYKLRVSGTRFKVYCLISGVRWWYNTYDEKGKWVKEEKTAVMITENDIVTTFRSELFVVQDAA